MRVAVVDMGSNSTRLLVADVRDGTVLELERRSIVTRLGEGLEATGRLGEAPQRRVFEVLEEYAGAIDDHDCEARPAVMTSAVRDAANGAEFAAAVRERFGLDAQTLAGEEEARLSYLGATAGRDPADPTPIVVIDIGGGSTELITGAHGRVGFHVSTQVGVVRHGERHLHDDPPAGEQLTALRRDARATFDEQVPAEVRTAAQHAVAVAGTATMAASMDLALAPYDSARVEGHRMSLGTLRAQLDRLAALPVEQRRTIPGLHPDRAPTIVAGIAILIEALGSFGLDGFEVSDRDILWGVALDTAARGE